MAAEILLGLLMSSPAEACGPYFDHTQLSWLGQAMLEAPTTSFDHEMARMAAEREGPPLARPRWVRTQEADARDYRAILGAEQEALVLAALKARAEHREQPAGVPQELRLYQEGAVLLYQEDIAGAHARWEALLALPESERRWRGAWAAYMLGNTAETWEEQVRWYQRVREEVALGGHDTLGLYVASLRQESAARPLEQPIESLSLCLRYRASGATAACRSLSGEAGRVLALEDLGPAVSDPLVAEAVAVLMTNPGNGIWWERDLEQDAARWLEAAAEAPGPVAATERLAWVAYRSGDMDAAGRWAALNPEHPISLWVQSKLALQRGDLEAAEQALAAAAAALPPPAPIEGGRPLLSTHCAHDERDPARAVQVELGIVRVARGDHTGALHAFAAAGDWMDAAWVAERLLDTDTLKAQVDAHWAAGRMNEGPPVDELLDGMPLEQERIAPSLRHLLARRLAREGRLDEAIPYFPREHQAAALQLQAHLQAAESPTLSADRIGSAQWEAAYLMKQEGWALLATEMEPDFRVLGGWYEANDTTALRQQAETTGPLSPRQEELARLAETAPPSEHRYHFVWVAAELAEEAVGNMDDDNPALPQALCTAGLWQRWRDPAYHERMFRALASRAPDSELNGGVHLTGSDLGLCQLDEPPPSSGCQTAPGLPAAWGLVGWLVSLSRRRRRIQRESSVR